MSNNIVELYTDNHVIELDHTTSTVRFYRRSIKMGEIVRAKSPRFVLNVGKEFKYHSQERKIFLAALKAWCKG